MKYFFPPSIHFEKQPMIFPKKLFFILPDTILRYVTEFMYYTRKQKTMLWGLHIQQMMKTHKMYTSKYMSNALNICMFSQDYEQAITRIRITEPFVYKLYKQTKKLWSRPIGDYLRIKLVTDPNWGGFRGRLQQYICNFLQCDEEGYFFPMLDLNGDVRTFAYNWETSKRGWAYNLAKYHVLKNK